MNNWQRLGLQYAGGSQPVCPTPDVMSDLERRGYVVWTENDWQLTAIGHDQLRLEILIDKINQHGSLEANRELDTILKRFADEESRMHKRFDALEQEIQEILSNG